MSATRARRPRAVDALLDSLAPLSFVIGKGGVGKTTCAVALTAWLAERGGHVLLVSTDPAGSLGTVIGSALTPGEQREIDELPGCAVMQLDAAVARGKFVARWRDVIVTIMDRGTYLDAEDIEGLVDAALPGGDEIFALLTLAELAAAQETRTAPWDHVIVDTAPTGHTLRLLALPDTFDALLALLEAMQAKHRFIVTALTHRYRTDAADLFLAEMRALIGGLRASLGNRDRTSAVLVARAEDVVMNESRRYAAALAAMHLEIAAVIVNAVAKPIDTVGRRLRGHLDELSRTMFAIPRTEPPPIGVKAIGGLGGRLRAMSRSAVSGRKTIRRDRRGWRKDERSAVKSFLGGAPHADLALSLVHPLTIVGGKGGVGKTTVSCALAIAAASARQSSSKVLLVSTDPAPSIADALGITDPQRARRGPEQFDPLPHLEIWQMDAVAAFEDLRDRYRQRIDQLFDAWIGQGVDASHDRVILRDLLALAPPGIDELYAVSALGEILDEHRYDCIVVDPAPTGHLLRLLELPTIALDWSHRLMRLILKYREISGLGDTAQELLTFSRRTRAFDALLHDPARAGLVLVTLDEPIVMAESVRLCKALDDKGIAVVGVLVNRVLTSSATEIDWRRKVVVAPESADPLIGIERISAWCRRWHQRD